MKNQSEIVAKAISEKTGIDESIANKVLLAMGTFFKEEMPNDTAIYISGLGNFTKKLEESRKYWNPSKKCVEYSAPKINFKLSVSANITELTIEEIEQITKVA